MIERGHPVDYFFSLSTTDKLFCHAVMEAARNREAQQIKYASWGLYEKKGV
ncbi:hypothetical protein [Veillonella magna]|uniref:Uncharacterized protein n=1 Tax=Veillonella magna TaxID=464322 RepID=A0ABS2GG24_9FIRM|nr:hypothetical protein [Veillonella magna]MBM6824787.1 hypothetical protein [Veillonella magna]MBM6913134.1 hypothetical protein [Veillonella magna]